ncbi:MAG: MCE family protein [Deltaproteobacteria bacterium]|nr:MCE family protein [Deltaproteobacteria bacterium]
MRNLGPAVKVGLTFVVAAVAGYWSFMMLAKGGCGTKPEELRVHAYFKDATLLVEKSRVQIAGLTVGHIVSRELNVRPPRVELIRDKRFAKISVSLNKGVTLYSNAVIHKRSASLLGEFYLEVDPGTYQWVDDNGQVHVGETLKDGAEVRFVGEAATASGLVQQLSDVVPVLRDLAQDVRSFIRGPLASMSKNINEGINENRQAVKDILGNVDVLTRDLRKVTAGADKDVRQIIDDVKVITSQIRSIVGEAKTDQYGNKLKDGLGKLSSAIDKLDTALANVEEVSTDVKDGKGTIGRLLKDDTLVNEVEGVVRDASSFVKQVTGLQTIVGLRSEYNFQAGSIKTYVTLELQPRPDKYYLIELVDDPRGRRTNRTVISRSDDPSRPLLTREERIEISDAFRMTFQFAKRIGPFTFRFGIKESTGGIGADVRLLRDRIQIQTDLFDFQANIYPRLKALAAWEFFKRLYVVGGIDDAFNRRPEDGTGGGRDFFLGGQIRFNDDDLKQLLLFGGSALTGSTGAK